ncbi:MAG: FAD:protein FMN transferase [Candidatus Eisenbacteria bacterium]
MVDGRLRAALRAVACGAAALLVACGGDGRNAERRADSGSTDANRVGLEANQADSGSGGVDAAHSPDERSVHYRTEVMGTWGTVTIVTADSVASAEVAATALETWHHVDRLLSNWKETSELSRVNREAAVDTVETDRELSFVLGRALQIAEASGGAFDVTVEPLVRLWGFLGGTPHVPSADDIEKTRRGIGWQNVWLDAPGHRVAYALPGLKVDLGGIAKGYGVDLAYGALREAGVSGMADLSGNIRTLGTPPGRDAWVVGIRDPRDRLPFFAKLRLGEAAMATSGQYEQFVTQDGREFGHILDPRTGWPAEGLLSVTVLAPTATEADAWATALFVLGPARAREVAKQNPDLAVVLVEDARHAAAHEGGADGATDGKPGGVGSSDGLRDVVWVEADVASRFELIPTATFLEVRPF